MDIDSEYQKTLDYFYSFVDYSLTKASRYSPEKFNLGRMEALMARLGKPHRPYPVIHLAGTKGKGSTAALIASALTAGGYKTGFYSSPHLQDFAERIQINGAPIAHADVVTLVDEMRPHAAAVPEITTFELMTGLAFLHFARQAVDVAVIEVGLGGRLDATNVVEPLVSVITALSYDHMAFLGDTLAKIAYEKSGIIKPGRPVVVSPQPDEARLVVEAVAAERGCELTTVGRDIRYAPWDHNLEGQSLLVWKADEQDLVEKFMQSGGRSDWQPVKLSIPLLGRHQVDNAATAYAALQVARRNGLSITEAQIRAGFSQVFWPGRFEILRKHPPLVVDSAHNRDSALKLKQTIDDYLQDIPVILLFGASEDKDIAGMFAELLPRVSLIIATQSFHPRAMQADKLVELAHQFGKPAQAVQPIEKALETALLLAGSESAVVATGSIFIAGATREIWEKMGQPLKSYAAHR